MEIDWISARRRDVASIDHVGALSQVLEGWTAALGFDCYGFCMRQATSLTDPDFMVVENCPESFRDVYIALDGLRTDPVLLQCYEQAGPVFWDEAFAAVEPGSAEARYVDAIRAIGLRAGLNCAHRGARGQLSVLAMALERDDASARAHVRTYAPQVIALGTLVHDAATRLLVDDPVHALTPRERECLLWAAEGCSARVTAERLAITERTVTFHLRNVNAKLGVSSRQQAVARAVSLGILEPRPQTMPLD